MKQEFNYAAGIDISKKTFDITISQIDLNSQEQFYRLFQNNLKGCKQLIKWIESLEIKVCEVLFCMENTGIYHRFLAAYLESLGGSIWIETGYQIKWSMGLQRGKNDKADSERILLYAIRNKDKAKFFVGRSKELQQIADLLAVRKRLLDCIKILKVPAKELKSVGLEKEFKLIEKSTRKSISAMKVDVKKVEQTIKELIAKNEELAELYKYVSSVKSVGFVAACYLLVYTDGFTKFETAKQIASYCGIAPFEHSSGTSVKGRTRVHPMANKNLKTVMHMCAISSLANNKEMKMYFDRKVGEGKNKMLVINAIRNKLVSRIFSCVKNKKMYQPYIIT